MTTLYPASLDNFTNPTPADNLNTPTVLHSTQHANINDAVSALETKLGIDSSATTSSIDYLLKSTSSVSPGHKHNSSDIIGGTGTTVNTLQVDQTPAGGTYGTLAGTVNGSNAIFTVSNSAYVSGSLVVFLNGQEQTQGSGTDWTETSPAAGTFTFAIAPPTGSIVLAVYIKTATSSGVNLPVATVGSINGLATGSTLLYANSSGSSLLVEDVALICTAATGASNGPTAQIGSTATGSEVYASIAISALFVVNKIYHFGGPGMSVVIPNGGSLYIDITAGGTGTALTLKAAVIGNFV